MKYIILALVVLGCENQFDVEETNQGLKPRCERYQGIYEHTLVSCGDYYDEVFVLCDENNNYERGSNCINPSDILDIVRENRPCSSCGCVVENVCAR
tara:strand:+ start:566 stop:856 length:291 start_codon:yes stop_codon:yes gene_type:complete